MNPLVLIGIGAAVLMAMGGKKKNGAAKAGEGEYGSGSGSDGEAPQQQQQQQQPPQQQVKKAVLAKLPPLRWRDSVMKGNGGDAATACWNAGHKEEMDLTMCIAKKLFPTWDWENKSGWQTDAWPMMRNVARVKLGLQPLIG